MHRNPLLSGVASIEMIRIDALHTLHLGVWQNYIAIAFNRLLALNPFRIQSTQQAEAPDS